MDLVHNDSLLSEFKSVISTNNISTLFQPIISLTDGTVLGYEALSRGPGDSYYYNPHKLFEAAKNYDMLWDLELVCRTKALENSALKLNGKKLFINIDPNTIQDINFKKGFTKEVLGEYMVEPSDIIFEITENTAIKDFKNLRNILDSYVEQGYNIALDDTGSHIQDYCYWQKKGLNI